MSTAAPRGTVCPLHSVTRTQLLTPQQRFEQMFVRGLPSTGQAPFYSMVWTYPQQYTELMQPRLPGHSVPFAQQGSIRVVQPAVRAQYILSSAPDYDTRRILYAQNMFFQPVPPGRLVRPLAISRYPVIRPATIGHRHIIPVPTLSRFSFRPNRYVPPRFTPKYSNNYYQCQPQHPIRLNCHPFSPLLYSPIKFPCPLYSDVKRNYSARNVTKSNWDYQDFITDNKDDPIVISDIDEPKPIQVETDLLKDIISFDYLEASNSVSVSIQPESLPASNGDNIIEFRTATDKPPYSMSAMIGMAISSAPNKQSTIRDIYNYISNVFPYYERNKRAWKNSVRHCLKTCDCFKQVSGSGLHWTIDDNSNVNFMKGSFQKPQKSVNKKRLYTTKRQAPKNMSGDSLDSVWLFYAKELNIKIIPNSEVEIYELVPPDTPPFEGSFETFIM